MEPCPIIQSAPNATEEFGSGGTFRRGSAIITAGGSLTVLVEPTEVNANRVARLAGGPVSLDSAD
jgi:hypothetical protein